MCIASKCNPTVADRHKGQQPWGCSTLTVGSGSAQKDGQARPLASDNKWRFLASWRVSIHVGSTGSLLVECSDLGAHD